MSLEVVKNEIFRFLESNTPEVLAIRGAWGVGKTYAWNKFIEEAKNDLALEKYSYVSLFGINTLQELKLTIFENVIDKSCIGQKPNLETLKTSAQHFGIFWGRKLLHLGLSNYSNFALAFERISFLSLKKTIVCIDDFERKGDGLTPVDVLGLICLLKEQKDCKIVLILNDESLENHKEQFEKLREKVIDIDILFNPSPEECEQIALFGEGEIYNILRTAISDLNINNIRIIKRIERLAVKISDKLSSFEPEVIYQALRSLALFTYFNFSKEKNLPNLQFIKEYNFTMFFLKIEKTNPMKKRNGHLY